MATVDFRTRFEGDALPLEPASFLDEQLPVLRAAHRESAGDDTAHPALPPLTLDVGGEQLTFATERDGGVDVRPGGGDALVVTLDRSAFSDLVQDVASTFGLHMTGRAAVQRGALDDFLAWEPVLRSLLAGRPVYEPGTITCRDHDGTPLDLQRSFTLDDPRQDVGHFLAEAGFLHLEGVFTEAEMAAVSAELDDAIARAERDDGASWWARTEDGEWYPSRILGFNQQSPTLRELLQSERFTAVPTFTDDDFVPRDPEVGDSAEGLLKKVGVVEGISDVSWHKDCSLGNHSRSCCSLIVGLSITGATQENGELGAVAGSHRANVAPLGIEGVDLPRVPLPTRTGDLTVHCSCTLHMSRPPVSAERRVVYTGFDLAPRADDRRPPLDLGEVRRERASLNDHLRRQQRDGDVTAAMGTYEL